jgi:hypothetical protein
MLGKDYNVSDFQHVPPILSQMLFDVVPDGLRGSRPVQADPGPISQLATCGENGSRLALPAGYARESLGRDDILRERSNPSESQAGDVNQCPY